MIHTHKPADECRAAGAIECWLLHGAVGLASDWRSVSRQLAQRKIGSRAVDLWRFLDCCPMPMDEFGRKLNAEASGTSAAAQTRILVGYSMGGRLALHALLDHPHPWHAAIIISANPGIEDQSLRSARIEQDAAWASRALLDPWDTFLDDWNAQPVLAGTSIHSRETRSRLAQRRKEIARSFIDWSVGAQTPLWPRLSEIQVPVLWLAGGNDLPATTIAQRVNSLIPTCSTRIAPGCGHRVPWQGEAWVVDQVTDFLRNPEG